MLKIITWTISVLETDISQISVSLNKMKFPVCFRTVWAIAGAKLVRVAHVHSREQSESGGKQN